MNPIAEWCPWCNTVMRGKMSMRFGICSGCRKTPEGKELIKSYFSQAVNSEQEDGKGLSSEAIIERWKKTTKGIVICLNDPKLESEGSFVMYEPTEKYHVKELKIDSIKKSNAEDKGDEK